MGNVSSKRSTGLKCSPVRSNHNTCPFSLKSHLSHPHAKLERFVQACAIKAPIRCKSWCSNGRNDATILLLGLDPARMVVSSMGTFTTKAKLKTHLISSLCSLLPSKKAVPVQLIHSLNNYRLLLPLCLSLKMKRWIIHGPAPQRFTIGKGDQKSNQTRSKSQGK